MNYKNGVKNIFWSIIGQAITLALGIIIPRLVIVSYSSEINGLLNSASQIITYLALLEAGVGTVSLQALYKPIANEDTDSINAIMSATSRYYKRTGYIYSAFIVAISFIYPLLIKSSLNYFFMAGIIFISGLPNVINYLFQGKLRILIGAYGYNYFLTNISTVTSCFASIAKILLLLNGMNVMLVQTVYCVISLIQMLFIYIFIGKKFPWLDLKANPDYKAIGQKNSALIHQVCALVTHSTDVTVLSIFCGLDVASIYTVYSMVFNIISGVASSVNDSLQYLFGQSFSKSKDEYIKIIDIYETYYMGIVSALMCAALILITPFIKLYTSGADINYVDRFLPVLFACVKIFEAMRKASLNTISVAGHFSQTRKFAVTESVINLSISLIAVQFMGIYGVLIGTVVALLYRNVVSIYYSNIKILHRNCNHSIVTSFTNLVLLVLAFLITRIISLNCSNYLDFIICAIPVTLISLTAFLTADSIVSRKSFLFVKSLISGKIKNSVKKRSE